MSDGPRIAVVAGSGISLLPLLTAISHRESFHEIEGLTPSGVRGHAGEFVWGTCGETALILQSGRLHLYEGLSHEEVVRPVDLLAERGIRAVLFTNAAGGLLPETQPGHLVAVERIEPWPCRAWPNAPASLQPDHVLDGCDHRGVYRWVHGPCYETRAEVRALQTLGGAAVGMSTAPEVQRCTERGIQTAVISCITNCCCVPQVLTHDHVVETARRASLRLGEAIRMALPRLLGAVGD